MSVVCVGSVNIDDVYKVQHIVKKGETIASTSFEQLPGGKGANQSVALAQAGGKVYHVGAVGKDGIWVRDLMKSKLVVVENLVVSETDPSGKAVVQVSKDGENAIVLFPGANYGISPDHVLESIDSAQNAKWLLCQGELLPNITSGAIKHAKSKGLFVCLNPAPFSPSITKDLDFSLVDLLIVNEVEFEELFAQLGGKLSSNHEADVRRLMDFLPSLEICVLTLGSKGGALGFKLSGSIEIVCAEGVKLDQVVDTTGAGDTFVGYFLARIASQDLKSLDNDSIAKAFNTANVAAGLSCTKKGAMHSIPSRQEVETFLNRSN